MLPLVLVENETTRSSSCVFEDPTMAGDAVLLKALLSIHGFISVTIILVNFFTMAAIWPRRHRRATQSTLFVLHLAFADMLCGISRFVFVVLSADCDLAELAATCEIACLLPLLFNTFTWMLSATTLAAIAVDRYVCIVHCLRYYEFMNTRRVIMILGSLWVVSLACTGINMSTWEWKTGRLCEEQNIIPMWSLVAIQLPLIVLVLAVVAATHIRIRVEVKKNIERCRALGNCPRWIVEASSSSSASILSARIVMLVVSCFVMCYLPIEMLQLLHSVLTTEPYPWNYLIITIFSSLWYLLNPFIYAWKNAAIREDVCILWQRIVRKLTPVRFKKCPPPTGRVNGAFVY